jgi:hypothetical protein
MVMIKYRRQWRRREEMRKIMMKENEVMIMSNSLSYGHKQKKKKKKKKKRMKYQQRKRRQRKWRKISAYHEKNHESGEK